MNVGFVMNGQSKRPGNSPGKRWLGKSLGLIWFGQKCPLCTLQVLVFFSFFVFSFPFFFFFLLFFFLLLLICGSIFFPSLSHVSIRSRSSFTPERALTPNRFTGLCAAPMATIGTGTFWVPSTSAMCTRGLFSATQPRMPLDPPT